MRSCRASTLFRVVNVKSMVSKAQQHGKIEHMEVTADVNPLRSSLVTKLQIKPIFLRVITESVPTIPLVFHENTTETPVI